MAKRNLSKKPKRKQLSRKLKRKTLNRKKVGKGGNRGGVPNDNNPNSDNVIGAIIMSFFGLIIFLILLKEMPSQQVVSGGTVSNNDLYNSLLNTQCLNENSKFYKEFKTLYDKVEITKDYDLIIKDELLKDEELLKKLSQNEFLNEHITGNRIHIKNMSKDDITICINEIELLYPNQDLLDIACINAKVKELNKTPTLGPLQ